MEVVAAADIHGSATPSRQGLLFSCKECRDLIASSPSAPKESEISSQGHAPPGQPPDVVNSRTWGISVQCRSPMVGIPHLEPHFRLAETSWGLHCSRRLLPTWLLPRLYTSTLTHLLHSVSEPASRTIQQTQGPLLGSCHLHPLPSDFYSFFLLDDTFTLFVWWHHQSVYCHIFISWRWSAA